MHLAARSAIPLNDAVEIPRDLSDTPPHTTPGKQYEKANRAKLGTAAAGDVQVNAHHKLKHGDG